MIKTNFKESINYMKGAEEYNIEFLRIAERVLNDKARIRGYLYENEIFEVLGIPWNPANENRLWLSEVGKRYYPYPGRHMIEYIPGSGMLLIHDLDEEQS